MERVATEVRGADKGERVEEPSPGVGRSLEGACNEAPAVVEVAETFTFVAKRRLIWSPTREARSSSAEEGEAVGRREMAEREVEDCVTATLALSVV